MNVRERLDVEDLLWIALALVVVLLVIELARTLVGMTVGLLSEPLVAIAIVILLAIWYLRRE